MNQLKIQSIGLPYVLKLYYLIGIPLPKQELGDTSLHVMFTRHSAKLPFILGKHNMTCHFKQHTSIYP